MFGENLDRRNNGYKGVRDGQRTGKTKSILPEGRVRTGSQRRERQGK